MNPDCFHCGLPVYDDRYRLTVAGEPRPFCCVGCLAAAQTILDNGLEAYYRFHDPAQAPAAPPVTDSDREKLLLYDRADVQAEFVSQPNPGQLTATLMIEGVSCSACSWLIEKHLARLPGVTSVHFNQTSHRCQVSWNPDQLPLSDVFLAVFGLGYRAHPYRPDQEELLRQKEQRQYVLRLGIAGLGMMQAMMNAVAIYSGNMTGSTELLVRWASLVLTIPVVVIAAGPFFRSAWRSLKVRHLSMDVSVALAIGSAFVASVWATLTGGGEVYYESVNMFTFFLVLGRFLEFRARTSVHASGNALASHLPATCQVWREGHWQRQALRDIHAGERILIQAGELCPVDGVVRSGCSEFDESRLTGEFKPRSKAPGDAVLAGTLNQSQAVEVDVERTGQDSSASSLMQLLERAASEKPRLAELADRGAHHFVASTLLITAIIGLVWLWVAPDRAFWVVISVLVVTCPCALSLATPTVLAQATNSLRQRGLIITRGHTLDQLASVTDLAFDKTGTLTEGHFVLTGVYPEAEAERLGFTEADLIAIAAELERTSEHPIARAFRQAQPPGTPVRKLRDHQRHPGAGQSARDAAGTWRLGHWDFASEGSAATPTSAPGRIWLSLNGRALAAFSVNDDLRGSALPGLESLETLGVRCHILTGDPNGELDPRLAYLSLNGRFHFGLSAEQKLGWVNQQTSQGARVAVVGDGINDAPVLAGAPVSVAMSSGTDLAKQAADALLLNENLTTLALAIQAARKTRRVIRQNLVWALLYNGLALPLAALGWVAPWQAAIGMSLSSLLVVGNALRLRRLS